MASLPALDSLPTEILLDIAGYLQSDERQNLRLMNHQLAQKLYPEMPLGKSINGANLRRWLETFVAMTEPGQPGCLITYLNIHELCKADSEQWRNTGHVDGEECDDYFGVKESATPQSVLLDLFARAFTNLSRNSDEKHLQLELLARPGKPSGDLFYCIAHALHESRHPVAFITLPLDEKSEWLADLDVFILGCDRLTAILEAFDLSASFKDLSCLSLHVAPTEDCIQWQDGWDHSKKPYDLDTSYYGVILTLLEICPALHELNLYGYNAWGAAKVGLLDQIVARCPDLPLGDVSLHGFGTADGELSRFLRHFSDRLRKVEIAAFMLTKEEIEDLFRIVVEELPWVEEVSFDNLEVVGPKNPALLHSPKYFHRRSQAIDLVCFKKGDRPSRDDYDLHAFYWVKGLKHINHGNDDWTKEGKDDSEPIAWTTSTPREGIQMHNYYDFYDWQLEMVRGYGGFWP